MEVWEEFGEGGEPGDPEFGVYADAVALDPEFFDVGGEEGVFGEVVEEALALGLGEGLEA